MIAPTRESDNPAANFTSRSGAESLYRAALLSELPICGLPVAVGLRMVRVEFNRPVVVFYRTAILAKLCV